LAIEERAYELGYDVLLAQSLNIPEREEACVQRFLSRRVDGLFIAPVYRIAPKRASTRNWRHGGFNSFARTYGALLFTICERWLRRSYSQAMRLRKHLLKLGHRRIAFLSGRRCTLEPGTFEGYRRALREANMDADESWFFRLVGA